jgi:membrane protein, antimicrobial resistance system
MGLVARFIGIVVAPRQTFQSIVPAPKWFGMLALSSVLIAIFVALPMTTAAGKQAWLDQQVEARRAFGQETSEQSYAQLEKMQPIVPYISAGAALVVSPIIALLFSGILFAIFNAALGGEASFKQVFSVFLHAGAVSTLGAVITGIVNYFRGGVTSVTTLGGLLPMLPEKSFAVNLLGMIDIIYIWYFIVLAIGLAVLYKRRTQPIAISLLSVYAVIVLGIALFRSRGGA